MLHSEYKTDTNSKTKQYRQNTQDQRKDRKAGGHVYVVECMESEKFPCSGKYFKATVEKNKKQEAPSWI